MKITTLPSGSINIRVYTHSEWETLPDGTKKEHKKFRSFTSKDASAKGKKKLMAEASLYAASKDSRAESRLTFNEGIKLYVEARRNVLSASTLREYGRLIKNGLPYLGTVCIDKVTHEQIQKAINQYSVGHAYKTVKNYRGYITAVLGVFRPDFTVNVRMPPVSKKEIYIPTDEELKTILKYVEGTPMEIPVMLAAFGPMRRSEICGLTYENIKGSVIYVCESVVRGEETYVKKGPKSEAGYRKLDMPDFVMEKLTGSEGPVTDLTPAAITCRFEDVLKNAGIKKFRFHDLRHYCISTMHKLGVPDADIILRSGHSSVAILEHVYLHATEDKVKQMNEKTNAFFTELVSDKS